MAQLLEQHSLVTCIQEVMAVRQRCLQQRQQRCTSELPMEPTVMNFGSQMEQLAGRYGSVTL